MDSQDGWRLQPVAEPVSYYDRMTGQWTSGSFETAVKPEQRAAVEVTSPAAAASSSSSSAFAAAAQHGSASTPAHAPWVSQCTSGPMLAASTAPPLYANAAGGTTVAEDRDAAADGGYRQFMPTPHATPTSRRVT